MAGKIQKKDKKKGFFSRMIDKLDSNMVERSKKKKCSCGCNK